MSRKKKRNENSSSEQGLHLKSTPKGYHVPQYVPRVAAPRFKPRRRYWRPRRRYNSSKRLSDTFLGVLIFAGIVATIILLQEKGLINVNSSNEYHHNDETNQFVNQHIERTESNPRATVEKKKKAVPKAEEAEHEQSSPDDDVASKEDDHEEEDSGLFDELFNKALSGADQSRQSRQPRYTKPRIPPNFVPSASWSPGNLERHWAKHGAEFPEYHSESEYGNGALYFFARPPPGTLFKSRGNGDRLYFHPASNTFGVTTGDGTPKTMFRPDGGMRYWERQ